MFSIGQNTTNCFLVLVGKDESRKINYMLKCNVITPVILDDWWSIHPASQADIEDCASSALRPVYKFVNKLRSSSNISTPHCHQCNDRHVVRKVSPNWTKMTNLLHFNQKLKKPFVHYSFLFLLLYLNQILLSLDSL